MNTKIHSAVWHPFTQHGLEPKMQRIVKAQDAYLFDEDGNRIFDAISSWCVTTHGHCHPKILDAIQTSCKNLDQIIFAEYTHEPAESLAQELLSLAPKGLKNVFYSDSGSTAVEVGIKMALGFFKNLDKPRKKIVAMEYAYHGDTIGTMSAGARGIFSTSYEPCLFDVHQIPFPNSGEEQRTLDEFEFFCQTGDVAAIVLEPLVLGFGGGFKIYPAWVLKELKLIAERYEALFIADEVMTGWGRTGTLFACEQANITPDILCTSKGLTAGTLPLAATLCVEKIFDAHVSKDRRKTFFHSSSYTANPIACSAALASIEIWKNEPVHDRISKLSHMQHLYLQMIKNDERFSNARQIGTITALDMNFPSKGYFSDLNPILKKFFREHHILLRPLGNVIYVMPPYCTREKDLELTYQAICAAADKFI